MQDTRREEAGVNTGSKHVSRVRGMHPFKLPGGNQTWPDGLLNGIFCVSYHQMIHLLNQCKDIGGSLHVIVLKILNDFGCNQLFSASSSF